MTLHKSTRHVQHKEIFQNDIPDGLTLEGDLALDTETLGLNLLRDRLCLLQIKDSVGKIVFVKFNDTTYSSPNLEKILLDPSRTKIFHYARFDILAIYKYLGIKLTNIFCTKIASKLTRTYTDSHGLKTICKEILSIELDKESQSSDWGAEVLTEKQLKYAANDVMYLHKLRDHFINKLTDLKRLNIAQECFNALPTVCLLDTHHFPVETIFSHK